MRRLTLAIVSLALAIAPATALAAKIRTLSTEVDATKLEKINLEVGVGDVEVVVGNSDSVRAEVILKPRRGGFFSSLKKAEKQVDQATLKASTSGATLELKIDGVSGDRRFEENWTLVMPAHLFFGLQQGVGDAIVTGLTNGIEIELGVGNATLSPADGSISAEVGVGELTIRAPSAPFGDVEASSGVGSVQITAGRERINGEGFVSHSAEWEGNGAHDIEAQTGVGDVIVKLD